MKYSNNLSVERKKNGWTLEYVGKKTDVTKCTVCDWEKGRRYPSYKALCKLENLFNMSHRELLAKTDEA